MPDCWLEVSTHPEGPATPSRFSVVFSRSWNRCSVGTQIPRCTACLTCRALPILIYKFRPKVAPPPPQSKFQRTLVPRIVSISRSSAARPCSSSVLRSTSHRSAFCTSQRLTFSSTYFYQRDERALPGNLHSRTFLFCPLPPSHSIFSLIHLSIPFQRVCPQANRTTIGRAHWWALDWQHISLFIAPFPLITRICISSATSVTTNIRTPGTKNTLDHSLVVSTPALCSGGPGFKSRCDINFSNWAFRRFLHSLLTSAGTVH
jgi:hypothetical protein